MIDKICTYLTNRIRKEMPEIDDERAEIIMYGLQNIIGELPKGVIILIIAYFLGIFKLTLVSMLIIAPYRGFSGGVHMKTHIGCIIYTLMEKERKQKQIFSYITLTIEFIIAILISNTTIVGIIIFGDFIQTLTITRLAYKITDNKYGHELYANI